MDKQNCLEIANGLVSGDRNDDYGHPFDDFSRSASMWSAILDCAVTPEQVALCMIACKISREVNKHKDDNLIDIAGYARTLEMVTEYRDILGVKVDAKEST